MQTAQNHPVISIAQSRRLAAPWTHRPGWEWTVRLVWIRRLPYSENQCNSASVVHAIHCWAFADSPLFFLSLRDLHIHGCEKTLWDALGFPLFGTLVPVGNRYSWVHFAHFRVDLVPCLTTALVFFNLLTFPLQNYLLYFRVFKILDSSSNFGSWTSWKQNRLKLKSRGLREFSRKGTMLLNHIFIKIVIETNVSRKGWIFLPSSTLRFPPAQISMRFAPSD